MSSGKSANTQTGALVSHNSVRKDGSLRICIDLQKLNQALKRCPHKIPTLEELNPQFAAPTVFSKLDGKPGHWSVHLGPDSQLITTFRTPFGRYCWTRLPFGLRVSQDIIIPSQNERNLRRPSRCGRDHRRRLRAWQR